MQKLPDQNEIAAIVKMRDDNVNLSWISYYIRGDKRLVQQLSTLTEALTEEPNLTYSAQKGMMQNDLKALEVQKNLEEVKINSSKEEVKDEFLNSQQAFY